MKEIGAMLKAAREEKGLSLSDLQMATKIRYQQLEAMEAGDFHKLPGEVYVRGFLINYAKHVGLDEEQVLAQYNARKKQEAAEETDHEAEAETEGTASFGGTVKRQTPVGTDRGQKKANLLVMASVGLVLVVGVAVGRYFTQKPTAGPVTDDTPVVVAEGAAEAAGAAPESAAVSAENSGQTGTEGQEGDQCTAGTVEPAAVLPADKGRLVVEASEVVWLGLYRLPSRDLIFEGTLSPGERREWLLTADVSLRIGNAGGLRMIYEGQDLGELGYSGQVITKVITVD